jgi:hypothetical protein
LNDVSTENRRNDGCDNLKDLFYSIPFNHNCNILKVRLYFAGQALLVISLLSCVPAVASGKAERFGAKKEAKKHPPPPRPPPYMGRMQHRKSQKPTIFFRLSKPGHGLIFLSAGA